MSRIADEQKPVTVPALLIPRPWLPAKPGSVIKSVMLPPGSVTNAWIEPSVSEL